MAGKIRPIKPSIRADDHAEGIVEFRRCGGLSVRRHARLSGTDDGGNLRGRLGPGRRRHDHGGASQECPAAMTGFHAPSPGLAGSGWPKAYSAMFRLAWELRISLSQHCGPAATARRAFQGKINRAENSKKQ